MSAAPHSRTAFLADAGRAEAAGWLALQLPWLAALCARAREDADRGAPFTTLGPSEARTLGAFAAQLAQLAPSDRGRPAVEPLGIVHFVNRALGAPHFAGMLPTIRAGLADLDRRARAAQPGVDGFAALPAERQVALMRAVEEGEFFDAARALVIIGMSADPARFASRDVADCRVLDLSPSSPHQPSFGPSDAELAYPVRYVA